MFKKGEHSRPIWIGTLGLLGAETHPPSKFRGQFPRINNIEEMHYIKKCPMKLG